MSLVSKYEWLSEICRGAGQVEKRPPCPDSWAVTTSIVR